MDDIFLDRFHAKIEQHLSAIGTPSPENGGLPPFVAAHLSANGMLFEDVLGFLRRYWERAKPRSVEKYAVAHETVLLRLLNESRGLLDHTIEVYQNAYPKADRNQDSAKIKIHYDIYSSKVREEIAFLQAVRRREISDGRQKWFLEAAIPIACVVLSAFLASSARTTLNEINAVRREIAEIARASFITSHLVLDGEGRFGGMPVHKAAARQRLEIIEDRLKEFFPSIHEETKKALDEANADAKKFWSLPEVKRKEYLKKYEHRPAK